MVSAHAVPIHHLSARLRYPRFRSSGTRLVLAARGGDDVTPRWRTLASPLRRSSRPSPRARGSAKIGDAARRRFAPRASASFSRARRAVLARASDDASATADEGPPDESQFGAEPWSGPGEDPISNEVLLKIVLSQIPDDEVNRLVWECLGCVPALAAHPVPVRSRGRLS